MAEEPIRISNDVEKDEEAQARVDIWKYVFGFTEMAVVKCAIELGIADVLEGHGGPMSLHQLSSALHCSPPSLYRILRFLTHRRIFKETSPPHSSAVYYAQTPLSRLLSRNSKNSMAAFVLLESSPVMLAPWHGLRGRVLDDGHPAFDSAHGKDVWRYAESNPEHSKLIDDAMACDTRQAMSAIIDGCPEIFEGISSVVDVGGGDGTALGILVQAYPQIRGINFDLPHVVSAARRREGVEHLGGDMFDSVPRADAAMIKWVLHDWGDEECVAVLRNCRKAIPAETGRVIIVEAVIDEEEEEDDDERRKKLKDVGLMLDMVMMAHTSNGKERTEAEWAHLLNGSGFTRFTVKRIPAVQAVIEAYA